VPSHYCAGDFNAGKRDLGNGGIGRKGISLRRSPPLALPRLGFPHPEFLALVKAARPPSTMRYVSRSEVPKLSNREDAWHLIAGAPPKLPLREHAKGVWSRLIRCDGFLVSL